MHITIGITSYAELKNLSFDPEVDLLCDALHINEFSADILTDDTISAGQEATLHDESSNIWANYWIDYAERVDADTVRVRARSEIAMLDGVMLEETVYTGDALSDVLDEVMVRQTGAPGIVAKIDYTLSSALSNATVSGYCPSQTARERLQWVCFAVGAYVKTAFVNQITVLPLDDTAALIPLDKTFWRPTVNHGDYVTAVKVTAYTFTQDSSSAASSNASYTFPLPWVASTQEYTLVNQNVPSGIADNVVEISELYLINQSNVSSILTRLATRYFKRTEVQLDAIDNGEFVPGDKVYVYADAQTIYTGHIQSASFKFGKQARATIQMVASEQVDVSALTINYTYDNATVHSETYYLPQGYAYSITTTYVDRTDDGRRRIYRPTLASVTGTVGTSAATVSVPCAVALELYQDVLDIISVDGISIASDLVTAVIQ